MVIGYQGGERNPHGELSGGASVRCPRLDGGVGARLGWWRVDPTAAVAPQRIEQPIDAAASQASDRVMFGSGESGTLRSLWHNAVWLADAVDLGWHRWVVGFSAERQTSLLEWLGLGRLRGFGLAIALLIAGSLAAAIVYLAAQLPSARTGDPLAGLGGSSPTSRRAGIDVAPGEDRIRCAPRRRVHFPGGV